MSTNRSSTIPIRQGTEDFGAMSDDDAIPGQDPKDTTELLAERLRAWKHAVAYIQNYVSATEKVEKAHAKEYEKVLKTIAEPLKEGHHFDQTLGGIAGLMDNMRTNTQGLSNSHAETEKHLKGSVLPILDRLHKEIKHKSKELTQGAGKGAKEVDKARGATQKHIELLGHNTASMASATHKLSPSDDPYVIHRGVLHRLGKQVMEENNTRNDTLAVQDSFANFEAHIISVIQSAMSSFNQFVGGQAAKNQSLYADMLGAAQRIPPDFEWTGFVQRNGHMLVDRNAEPRSVGHIAFPNMDHKSTKPLIEGTLERKSRSMLKSGYSSGYYVVTPAKYLHEFKDADNYKNDPVPETSIYLPDATIGKPSGKKFNVKGKDSSKGLGAKLSGTSEYAFQAMSDRDAEKWFEAIAIAAGSAPINHSSEPSSPVDTQAGAGMSPTHMAPAYAEKQGQPAAIQTQHIPAQNVEYVPVSATSLYSQQAPAGTVQQVLPAGTHYAPGQSVPYPDERKY